MKSKELSGFLDRFKFDPEMSGFVGVEREHLLMRPDDEGPANQSPSFLALAGEAWTQELTLAQVEDRTSPAESLDKVILELRQNRAEGLDICRFLGLRLAAMEVAPDVGGFKITPIPRYLSMAKKIGPERTRAAMRIMGVHVHVGVRDWQEAISVRGAFLESMPSLISMSDSSEGERLGLYGLVVPGELNPGYSSAEELFELARAEDFLGNPRGCHHLIRISVHGTVECRVFGIGPSEEILEWVRAIQVIAKS